MKIRNFLFAAMLAFCFEVAGQAQVYSYTDGYISGLTLVGYGAVTGYYNNSTSISSTTVRIYSPSGRFASASVNGGSATTSLELDGEHGSFSLSTSHVGTCPYGQNHTIGGSGGTVPVPKRCSLGTAAFAGSQTPTQLNVSVVCSRDTANPGSTSVTVGAYAVEPMGSWALDTIQDQQRIITDGVSSVFSFDFQKVEGNLPSSCPCTCKGEALLTTPSGVTAVNSPQRTASAITIQ